MNIKKYKHIEIINLEIIKYKLDLFFSFELLKYEYLIPRSDKDKIICV